MNCSTEVETVVSRHVYSLEARCDSQFRFTNFGLAIYLNHYLTAQIQSAKRSASTSDLRLFVEGKSKKPTR